MSPSSFRLPSSVLLAVTGMSPAILTETAWALAKEKPRRLPGKVVAFATTRSRDQLRKELIDSGVWESLRRAVRAKEDELIFGDAGDHIRVFSRNGKELDDLRTPDDNRAAADFILEHLRQFTENPDAHIVASIAGGRKTMGALLYAAMTLLGRETDRITHVLVDEALERRTEPRFYFPCSPNEGRGVQLADLPFVPLRNGFAELGRMPGGFDAMIRRYTRSFHESDAPRVALGDAEVAVDGKRIRLNRNELTALRFLMELNRKAPETRTFQDVQDELTKFLGAPRSAKEDLRKWVSSLRNTLRRHGSAWYPESRPHPLRLPVFMTEDGKRKTE